MRKLRKTLFLSSILLFIGNSCLADTEEIIEESSNNYTKLIVMGIAALIIILLLILGYKMDSKDNGDNFAKEKKSKKKKDLKKTEAEEVKYEADNVSYESDTVSQDEISESIKYDEDEESLFDSMNSDNYSNLNDPNIDDNTEVGDEFDTSIIDNIEDEEDIVIPDNSVPSETMIFNNPLVSTSSDEENDLYKDDNLTDLLNEDTKLDESTSDELKKENESKDIIPEEPLEEPKVDLISDDTFKESEMDNPISDSLEEDDSEIIELANKIDELDNLDDLSNDLDKKPEEDSFLNELKNIDKTETSFEGFSVSPNLESDKKESTNVEPIEIKEEKLENSNINKPAPKRYTKVKSTKNNATISDFMNQMEANLNKNKDEDEVDKK